MMDLTPKREKRHLYSTLRSLSGCGNTLAGWLHIDRHVDALLAGCQDYTVHRGDVGVIAADGEHNVLVGCEHVVGRVESDPACIRPAPQHNPGMHGVGALQSCFSLSRHAAQIAAHISSGQTDATETGNHDVCKILADAAAQSKRHWRRCCDSGRADFVMEIGFYPSHQLNSAIEHGAPGRKTRLSVVTDIRIERYHTAGVQKLRR